MRKGRAFSLSLLATALALLAWGAWPAAGQTGGGDLVRHAEGLTGDKLLTDVSRLATPDQRRRLARAVVEFDRGGQPGSRHCNYPTDLASVIATDDRYRIRICADNLRTLEFMLRQWSLVYPMPRRRDYLLLEYLDFVAGYLHQHRAAARPIRYPCSVTYYIYLARNGRQRECATTDEAGDAQYRRWFAENDYLADAARLREIRDRYGMTGVSDAELLDEFSRRYVETYFALFLQFIVAHELGHVASGDPARPRGDRCTGFAREVAADEFAYAYLDQRMPNSRHQVVLPMNPWFFLTLRVRTLSGRTTLDDPLFALRARTILDALSAAATDLRARLPAGPNRDATDAFLSDPVLDTLRGELAVYARCR